MTSSIIDFVEEFYALDGDQSLVVHLRENLDGGVVKQAVEALPERFKDRVLLVRGVDRIEIKEHVMKQDFESANYDDPDGNPAGGWVHSTGLSIDWQDGPLVVDGTRAVPNGAFVETVIAAAIQRIEYYQRSRFHCLENAVALGHLKAALEALEERTRGREDRGVEGTHEA